MISTALRARMVNMKKRFMITTGLILLALLCGCRDKEEMTPSGKDSDGSDTASGIFGTERTVGKDILSEDITDFYYTVENINYDAFYQRYRFYTENGEHIFFHETRERKDDYGPCTEEDTTLTGTIALTEEEWARFYDLVVGGIVKDREDSAEAGGTGPWLYLYWKGDKSKYQQFSFASYGKEKEFEEFCLSLVPESEDAGEDRQGELSELAGIWQTVSMIALDDETAGPEYHVRFTDQEIEYGHMEDDTFVTDHTDMISLFEELPGGGYRIQAETADGVEYTYQTSESAPGILDYYETWEESEFPDMYRGGASLWRGE